MSSAPQTPTKLSYTPIDQIPRIVQECRNGFRAHMVDTAAKRKDLLRVIAAMIKENEAKLSEAVTADLGRHPNETHMMEFTLLYNEIYHHLDHMDQYMKPENAQLEGIMRINSVKVVRDPLGVVLIICPWNYPVQLTLLPIVGAIAAGNTVVLKPSENSEVTSATITDLVTRYFPSDIIGVVNGAVEETTALLKERFDHIFFTGSTMVGRAILAAAAPHLTPVTLELGGKSPVIVDATCAAKLDVVATRLLWGKYINSGQTCVAPDYLLLHRSLKDSFIKAFAAARVAFMGSGDEPLKDPCFSHIINARQYGRLTKMLNSAREHVVVGGETDDARLKIAPTLLCNVPLDHDLMKYEIFGPFLPIVLYDKPEEAIEFILAREKPLALYLFSTDATFVKAVTVQTSSGGMLVNDVMLHVGLDALPFGGVGESGMGRYHGKYSFECFSHQKTVFYDSLGFQSAKSILYPPYEEKKLKCFRYVMEKTSESSCTMM